MKQQCKKQIAIRILWNYTTENYIISTRKQWSKDNTDLKSFSVLEF